MRKVRGLLEAVKLDMWTGQISHSPYPGIELTSNIPNITINNYLLDFRM